MKKILLEKHKNIFPLDIANPSIDEKHNDQELDKYVNTLKITHHYKNKKTDFLLITLCGREIYITLKAHTSYGC